MKLVFDWDVSAYYGWGVYGLNLGLELSHDPTIEASTTRPIDSRKIGTDALRLAALAPLIARSNQGISRMNAAWLHAMANNLLPQRPAHAHMGVTFFELPLPPEAIERAKGFDVIVTGSSWNQEILNEAGYADTRLILQGVDRSLFHPAPKRNLFPGRFLIFSGGKAEPRKGQDIVVAAFRIFARHHPEAMLVTAWHSFWPEFSRGMDLDLSEFPGRVIDVGSLPNGVMAPIYRECDVALFPNRAEGGTNLVAMECLACGVPTILSDNTGHRDLLRMGFGYRLSQKPCEIWSEWGESDVEEVVEALEWALRNAQAPRNAAELPQWSEAAAALVQTARDVYPGA
jgi:glycosyltransferase involved in cell wall biosynthesis